MATIASALLWPFSAAHAVTSGAFSLTASNSTPAVGDAVDVTMTLNTAGRSTYVVQADATYNASKLQLMSVDEAGGPFQQYVNGSRAGLVSVAVGVPGGQAPVTGAALVVINMHFTAIASGTIDIKTAGGAAFVDPTTQVYWPVTRGGATLTVGSASASSVAGLTPNFLGQSASQPVSISGRGLGGKPTIKVSGTGVTVKNVQTATGTAVKATFAVTASAAGGYRDVTVTSGGVTTTCIACFFVETGDSVTGVTPPQASRGTTVALHLDGIYEAGPGWTVTAGSGVTFTNVAVVTDDVNNSLSATLKVASNATTGTRDVTVTSLQDHAVFTCSRCLTVN